MAARRARDLDSPLGDPGVLRALSLLAIGAGVLGNIVYALTDGRTRVLTTVFSVLAFSIAALLHAASESGRALGAVVIGCILFGFFVELIGDRIGFPFGSYDYTDGVWAQLAGVPLVVPLAWAMMGWPAFVAGRFFGQPLLGAAILTAWDLFLDPQMVGEGHWTWAKSSWPTVNGIPISNTIGWLVVSALMMLILDQLVGHAIDFEGLPLLVLAWTWFSSIVGHLFFFKNPGVAIAGGLFLTLALAPVALVFAQVMSSPRRGNSSGRSGYADSYGDSGPNGESRRR